MTLKEAFDKGCTIQGAAILYGTNRKQMAKLLYEADLIEHHRLDVELTPEQIKEAYTRGGLRVAAKELKVQPNMLAVKLKKLGIHKYLSMRFIDDECTKDQIESYFTKGLTMKEICSIINFDSRTLRRFMHDNGISDVPRRNQYGVYAPNYKCQYTKSSKPLSSSPRITASKQQVAADIRRILKLSNGHFNETINMSLGKYDKDTVRHYFGSAAQIREHFGIKFFRTQDAFLDYFEKVTGIFLDREVDTLGCINPKTGGLLRFDGVSREYRVLVEYDDISHYREDAIWRSKLEERQYRDTVKDSWAKEHEFLMIRFPYFEVWTPENIRAKFPSDFEFPKEA